MSYIKQIKLDQNLQLRGSRIQRKNSTLTTWVSLQFVSGAPQLNFIESDFCLIF